MPAQQAAAYQQQYGYAAFGQYGQYGGQYFPQVPAGAMQQMMQAQQHHAQAAAAAAAAPTQ